MSVAIFNKETQETTGTYFVHTQAFEIAFQRLNDYIKDPIKCTVIAWNDHFDPGYQQRISEAIKKFPFGTITFIYHQTASAYYTCDQIFKGLVENESFGVINNHFNIYHLTLYQKTDKGYKAFFVNESSSFDQNFANLAARSKCQNYFINIYDYDLVEKTKNFFKARNVQYSKLSYQSGDGIARGALIKGIHLERSLSTMINDFLPYPIKIIYNHQIQNTIPPYTEAPFFEKTFFDKVDKGTNILIKQLLPKKEKIMVNELLPEGMRYGMVNVEKNIMGMECFSYLTLDRAFKKTKSFWIATGAACMAIIILLPILRR